MRYKPRGRLESLKVPVNYNQVILAQHKVLDVQFLDATFQLLHALEFFSAALLLPSLGVLFLAQRDFQGPEQNYYFAQLPKCLFLFAFHFLVKRFVHCYFQAYLQQGHCGTIGNEYGYDKCFISACPFQPVTCKATLRPFVALK